MSALPADSECVFCGENPRNVWADGGWKICSDPAPLSEGHLLIYTDAHYPSASDVELELSTRLDRLLGAIRSLLAAEGWTSVVFEHGRTGHCVRSRPGERLCHHAHVHVVPSRTSLGDAALSQRVPVRSWTEVAALGAETDGYAVIQDTDGEMAFFPITSGLAPHYLRTKLSAVLGVPERADWERFGSVAGGIALDVASHQRVAALARRLGAVSDV